MLNMKQIVEANPISGGHCPHRPSVATGLSMVPPSYYTNIMCKPCSITLYLSH